MDYAIKRCSEIEKFYASAPRSCGTLVIFSRWFPIIFNDKSNFNLEYFGKIREIYGRVC